MRTLKTLILTISLLTSSIASAQWPCPITDSNCNVNEVRARQAEARRRAEEEERQRHCRRYVNQCTHTDYPASQYACQSMLRQCMTGSSY